ncbi:hypothetical protein [Arthrobacter sp. 9V]|nr:hypothetical protein [Arthrobacter sp. 9V]
MTSTQDFREAIADTRTTVSDEVQQELLRTSKRWGVCRLDPF